MVKTESTTSKENPLKNAITDSERAKLKQRSAETDVLFPIKARLSQNNKRLKIGIIEVFLSIILGICAYWLWMHYAIINYDYVLKNGAIIAHLFRIQPIVAFGTIILIAIAFLCVIDAIRRILLSLFTS